jgi:hypothetical protein
MIDSWNRRSKNEYNLIGIIKYGQAIKYDNDKDFKFMGIGQLNASPGLQPDSTHLSVVDNKNNQCVIDISNKYMASAFCSNFILNKEGRSINRLLGSESTTCKQEKLVEMITSSKKESVFALSALISEKKYPLFKRKSIENLIESEMNVLNLHEIANEIECSGKSITQVFKLSEEIDEKNHTVRNKKNNKLGIKQ